MKELLLWQSPINLHLKYYWRSFGRKSFASSIQETVNQAQKALLKVTIIGEKIKKERVFMGYLVSVGVSAGILAAVFCHLVFFTPLAPVIAWVTFAAIACYFGAGGKGMGLLKGLAANITGVLWGALILFGFAKLGFTWWGLAIMVFIAVLGMCMQAKISYLSFIPGAFIGAAMTFGTEAANDKLYPYGDIKGAIIAIVIGGALGWLMDQGGQWIFKIFSKPQSKEISG